MSENVTTDAERDNQSAEGHTGLLGLIEMIVGPLTKDNAVSWIKSILVAVTVAVTFRYWVFDHYYVPSGSMIDTLIIKDKIVVNKFIYGIRIPFTTKRFMKFREPRRGDIVVFRSPEAASRDRKTFVKRLVGLPGERIRIKNGDIYVNGERVRSPASIADRTYYNQGRFGTTDDAIVPEGQAFVLGDNSRSSQDSRYWGFVPIEDIKGPAVAIWWPPGRIQRLK